MKHPPYHLRVNKAIDRFLLVEILNILKKHCDLSNYTYYGFGGPFLEDCRLINARCPEVKIVSIEKNEQTFKRQQFHCFSKTLDLRLDDFASFLANFSSTGGEILWLDYTDLRLGHFDDFMSILGKVSEKSIVKITIRAEPSEQEWEEFYRGYDQILPASVKKTDIKRLIPFTNLLQQMIQIASQKALPASGKSIFQLLDSSHYNGQTHMLSITGIVCNKDEVSEIQQWFQNWHFVNLKWNDPRKIDVPTLSTKERLHLEKYLPTKAKTGRSLSRALGYKIDGTEPKHLEKLKQYEEFYQYYPYFARISI